MKNKKRSRREWIVEHFPQILALEEKATIVKKRSAMHVMECSVVQWNVVL